MVTGHCSASPSGCRLVSLWSFGGRGFILFRTGFFGGGITSHRPALGLDLLLGRLGEVVGLDRPASWSARRRRGCGRRRTALSPARLSCSVATSTSSPSSKRVVEVADVDDVDTSWPRWRWLKPRFGHAAEQRHLAALERDARAVWRRRWRTGPCGRGWRSCRGRSRCRGRRASCSLRFWTPW